MSMSTNGVVPTSGSIERSNKLLAEMEKFSTSPGCRRRAILAYFGEDMGKNMSQSEDGSQGGSESVSVRVRGKGYE